MRSLHSCGDFITSSQQTPQFAKVATDFDHSCRAILDVSGGGDIELVDQAGQPGY
jgi:hypothetical protein